MAGRLRLRGDDDRWEGRAKVRLQGRGVLRPVVALVGLFGRRRVERALTDELGSTAGPTGTTDELRAVFGSDPDPAEIAAVAVERLLVYARPDR